MLALHDGGGPDPERGPQGGLRLPEHPLGLLRQVVQISSLEGTVYPI